MACAEVERDWELEEHATALEAREVPRLFVDYHEELGGQTPVPHAMHQMMHDFELCCLAEGRKMMLQAPPEHGKSTHMRGKRLWWRGLRTLPAAEQARIMRRNGERFYADKSDAWWLGVVPPAGTCAFISADVGLAKKNLIEISRMVERRWNRWVFPDLVPDIRRSKKNEAGISEWSSERLYFVGDVDPSFEVFPAHADAEGSRFAQRFMDDFFSQKGDESEAERIKQDRKCRDTWENRDIKGAAQMYLNNNWNPKDGFHKRRDADRKAGFSTLWIHYIGTDAIGWKTYNAPAGFAAVYGEWGELPLWEEVFSKARLEAKMVEDPESMDAWLRRWAGGDPPPEGAQFGEHRDWARYDVEEERAREVAGGEPFCFVAGMDPNGGKAKRKGDYAAAFLLRVWINRGCADVVAVWCRRGATSPPAEQMAVMMDWHEALSLQGRQGLRVGVLEVLPKEQEWVRLPLETLKRERMEAGRRWWNAPVVLKDPEGKKKEVRIHATVGPVTGGMIRWPKDLEKRMREAGVRGQDWRNVVGQMEVWTHLPGREPDHDDAPDGLSIAWKAARGMMGLGALGAVKDGKAVRVSGGRRSTAGMR